MCASNIEFARCCGCARVSQPTAIGAEFVVGDLAATVPNPDYHECFYKKVTEVERH